jgi:predicted enzyme related to lactoylglutathione lyase
LERKQTPSTIQQMKSYLGRTIILVSDYKKAFNFYRKNFGFSAIFDYTTSDGERYLHIGTDPQNSCGIWFLEAKTDEQKSHVGKQTGGLPLLVIYTTSLEGQYDKLKANDVKIVKEPEEQAQFKYFHCHDLYGNELIITELKD